MVLRFIRKWIMSSFGFSKSEANGSIVLILIVLIIAVLPRWFINMSNSTVVSENADKKALQEWYNSIRIIATKEKLKSTGENKKKVTIERPLILQAFDPNEVTVDELLTMGFPQRIAQNLVNYRIAGGFYQEAADLKKIYGMDDLFLKKLEDYLLFADKTESNPPLQFSSQRPTTNSDTNAISSININLASADELTAIKGIGPVLSQRIVKYRALLGGFHRHDQLFEIYGLEEELINNMKNFIHVDSILTKININHSEIKRLSSHPYIDYALARSISNYRKVHGPYQHIEDLKQIKIIDDSLFQKLSPYISVTSSSVSE